MIDKASGRDTPVLGVLVKEQGEPVAEPGAENEACDKAAASVPQSAPAQESPSRQESGFSKGSTPVRDPAFSPVDCLKTRVGAYIGLTKPRVIELLLVAAIPAMLQADRGHIKLWLIILILIGGWLGAASANTFNMVADADIDQVMKRTERRPLAQHTVTRRAALVFAILLGLASFLWLWLLVHSLKAAVFILLTIAFYVFVYTLILKRRTVQNVVWGGAAGCMPVMVAWAGVTDNLPAGTPAQWWQAIVLFLVIFFWTPPHTWALAMRYKSDYEAAGVPMLPVVKPAHVVTRQMVIYVALTVLATLCLIPAASWIYLAVVVIAGGLFLAGALHLNYGVTHGKDVKPIQLFTFSNNYLALISVGLSVDAILNLPTIGSLFAG